LVVSCRYDDIDVQIIKINKVETERCFNGRTTISGIINISSEDEDDFQAEFIYKGKTNESKSQLLNYVRGIGIEVYKSKIRKQEQTLLDYVSSFDII